jgi:tetratricopeptide (TPR) repeat protein
MLEQLLAMAIAFAPTPAAFAAARQASLITAVREGDAAFEAFNNDDARHAYERAFAIDSTSCDVSWKLARANVHRGMVVPEKEKEDWFVSAAGHARRAVALCPDSADAHFFLAVSVAQITKVIGGKRRIELSKDVKHEAEAALSLDPAHAGAMHVLGRWNYEIAGLGWLSKVAAKVVYGGVPPGASYEQAKEWFERAIAARPDMPLNHLWLGETLIKLHDYAGARARLEECIARPDVLWDDPRSREQARNSLREIEDKK